MLKVKNLHVDIKGQAIINNLNFEIQAGEVHAIMGPNGSGKSTFAKVLAGHPDYKVKSGSMDYQVDFTEKNLLNLEPYERALEGIFLAYQYPIEIPGLTNMEFLRSSFNAICKHQGTTLMEADEFENLVLKKSKAVQLNPQFLYRSVNEGFSGGEKKRNELLQMTVLSPRLCVLDEIDSGLDIDSLKIISDGVNSMRSEDRAIIIITHYQRLLEYIQPDYVHVFKEGRIVKSGNKTLAQELEDKGYDWI